MTDRLHRQQGQAALLAVAVLLLTGLVVAGLGRLGATAALGAQAQAAADAAALAGADAGPDASARAAADNGATLVEYRSDGLEVQVTVERGPVRATARARWTPAAIP